MIIKEEYVLEQIGNSGLYTMQSPVLDFLPNDLLPADLDSSLVIDEATDELVRLLLEFSYERNAWVGVSWKALEKKLDEDLARHQELLEGDRPKQAAYEQAKQTHARLNKWTLGLYGHIQPPPLPSVNMDLRRLAKHLPWIYHNRWEKLLAAAAELKAQGYVNIIADGETDVYFITSALVCQYARRKKA